MRTHTAPLAVCLVGLTLFACEKDHKLRFSNTGPEYAFRRLGRLVHQERFGDYDVRIYCDGDSGEGSVEILRGEKRLWGETGWWYDIGRCRTADADASVTLLDRDITGDGRPNLVIFEWTGGAHCCFYFQVFDIGESFRKLATIDAGHGGCFEDLDGDADLEFVTADWSYAYFWTDFASSPAPTVVLRYRDGSYRLAGDAMVAPPPARSELEEMAREYRARYTGEKGRMMSYQEAGLLWEPMLRLIYTGNLPLAREYFDLAWPPTRNGRAEASQGFWAKVADSPYWPEVSQLSTACPE